MSFRVEEKIIIHLSEINRIKSLLLNKGGKELYPKRKISSLYFDSTQLKMFTDSEEGITPRKKIRVRMYPGDNTNKGLNLETKISSAEGRFKKSINFNEKEFNKICDQGIYDADYGICYPQIWVEYCREYFIVKNQRVTLDYNLLFKSYKSKVIIENNENLILEIKGDNNFKKDSFDNIIPYRRYRFSKYNEGIKEISAKISSVHDRNYLG